METRRSKAYFDLISFGGFLIIVGLIFFLYPDIPSAIRAFFEALSEQRRFPVLSEPRFRPLPEAAAIFFAMLGILNFLMAGIRLVARWPWQRSLNDASWGIALVFLGYLIWLYSISGGGVISGWLIWPTFLIVAGILVAVNGLIRYYYAPRERPMSEKYEGKG